jgi:2-polyprenyl-3-methyl-5-hydroxy-6-metoxy-1,4-benzoquinol methylase
MEGNVKPLEYSPVLVETVEQALEPYKKILSPEMLEHFRQEALLELSNHPYPAALIRKLTPDPVVQASTDVPVRPSENTGGRAPKKHPRGK